MQYQGHSLGVLSGHSLSTTLIVVEMKATCWTVQHSTLQPVAAFSATTRRRQESSVEVHSGRLVVVTPCACMHRVWCSAVSLKVCLSALFWAICAFEERSRAHLNPER